MPATHEGMPRFCSYSCGETTALELSAPGEKEREGLKGGGERNERLADSNFTLLVPRTAKNYAGPIVGAHLCAIEVAGSRGGPAPVPPHSTLIGRRLEG